MSDTGWSLESHLLIVWLKIVHVNEESISSISFNQYNDPDSIHMIRINNGFISKIQPTILVSSRTADWVMWEPIMI